MLNRNKAVAKKKGAEALSNWSRKGVRTRLDRGCSWWLPERRESSQQAAGRKSSPWLPKVADERERAATGCQKKEKKKNR